MSEHVLSTHTLIRLLALFVCLFDFVVVVGEGIWRGLMHAMGGGGGGGCGTCRVQLLS